ncbi:MAG TPA: hypothetical protein VGO45_13890 [Bacteroidia bacterium]|nr:hypothetical protein [Bacteroidia bacterium]
MFRHIYHIHLKIILLLGLGFGNLVAFAQKPVVSASLDTSVIRLGEQTTIRLKLSTPSAKASVTWPQLQDTITKGIQVVFVSKTDTLASGTGGEKGMSQFMRRITITSFDSGYYAIPPFRIILNNDTANALMTDAMLLHVKGMQVDTTLAIKDIKQPLGAPFDWHELIPWIKWIALGLVALAGLIFLIRYLIRKKPAPAKPKVPDIPPHITALERLHKLREQKLWQNGMLKLYHSELTDIIRTYLEGRFQIHAMEQTSDEILSSLRSVPISEESKNRLKQVFKLADLVKFARQQTLPDENEMSMDNAFAFVNETKAGQTETKDNQVTQP